MSGPAVIDLGVYAPGGGTEPAPDAPWLTRSRLARWWRPVAAALAAVVVLPLAGASPAPASPLALLWTVPGGPYRDLNVAVGGTDLYAISRIDGGSTLTAYRAEDGAVKWSAPLADSHGTAPFEVTVVDGLPLVYTFDRVGHTAAYDPDTAQLRWTSQGYPDYVGGGVVGFLIPVLEGEELLGTSIELRDTSSGAVALEVDGRAQSLGYGSTAGGKVLAFGLDHDGWLSSYDMATGTVLRRVPTGFSVRPGAVRSTGVSVAHGSVIVSGEIGVDDVVAAYDAATLEQMWRIGAETPVWSCGPVVCVGGVAEPLRGVAPETGAPRWTMSCADAGVPGECFLHPSELGPGDRLQLTVQPMDTRPADLRYVIVDAVTGRPVTGHTGWEASMPGDGPGLLLSRGEGAEPHRVWWARSGPDLDRIEVLGAIEADRCGQHHPYLVCHTADGAVEVWRVRGA